MPDAAPQEVASAPAFFDAEAWAARTARPGDRFDEREAARAAAFFTDHLVHTKGRQFAGKPFALEPWQASIIRALFGWKREDGTRRFRQLYLEVPRKNGKTQLAAGIGLFCLVCDFEPGAEVYSCATDTDQAAIVFQEAVRMRTRSAALRQRTTSFKHALVAPSIGASWKVMSAEAGNKDGLNAHCIIYDEVHAFRDRALFDVMHTSTGARVQPLEVFTTTAGADDKSLWWELRQHAIRVRDGKGEDPELLPVVYAADPEDPIDSPATWAKANPNLGVSISADYLAKEAKKAAQLPRYAASFKRLHLNIKAEATLAWLPMKAWDAAPPLRKDLAGRKAYAGLDLSSVRDTTAFVLVLPDEDGCYDVLAHFWLPRGEPGQIEERERQDRQPYRQWAAEGWLDLTEGNTVDYEHIRKHITGLVGSGETATLPAGRRPVIEEFDLQDLALDRWNATQMATWLQGDGVTVTYFGQGFASMSAPAKLLETLVLQGRFRHGGNPVLRWMADNARIATDPAENIKPVKDKSSGRIDGIVAACMGLGRAMVADAGDAPPGVF